MMGSRNMGRINVPTAGQLDGGGAARPSPSSEGLVLWVKGDAGLTVAATRLSNWADQSGYAQDLTEVNPGNYPYVLGDELNGIPLVSFGASGLAAKRLLTSGNFKDRNGVAMDVRAARTVIAMGVPRFDPDWARTGGPLFAFASFSGKFFACMFALDSLDVANGAFGWSSAWRDPGSALQFTPVAGGAGGPYDGVPTLLEWSSSGYPNIGFRINNVDTTLTPGVQYGGGTGVGQAILSADTGPAWLGSTPEVLAYDYDLRTNPAAHAQTIAYMVSRYS